MPELICQSLDRLVRNGHSTAKEIGDVAEASSSTVYRWLAGQSEPTASQLRKLLHGLRHPQAQQTLWTALTSGSKWHAVPLDLELDVNADGQVDHEDALDAACLAIDATSKTLVSIRSVTRGKRLDPEQTLDILALLDSAIRHCATGQKVLVDVNQRRKRALRPGQVRLADEGA